MIGFRTQRNASKSGKGFKCYSRVSFPYWVAFLIVVITELFIYLGIGTYPVVLAEPGHLVAARHSTPSGRNQGLRYNGSYHQHWIRNAIRLNSEMHQYNLIGKISRDGSIPVSVWEILTCQNFFQSQQYHYRQAKKVVDRYCQCCIQYRQYQKDWCVLAKVNIGI